ncbi:MAG: SDR family oxidoreductase [Gammaproteobacteria bacterium]|nr:SDR family oxidoreductase [Gammaproteobacteria bacterium]
MRVLVTGASRGIGRAICQRIAADSRFANVQIAACGSTHAQALQSLADELRADVENVVTLTGDLSLPSTSQRLVAEACEAMGGIDAIVSNAGIGKPNSLRDMTVEQWDQVFNTNLRATWLLAQAAYEELRRTRGHIITVASMSGVAPQPGMGAYSPAKAGLIMLTRLMAQEWADARIRANCVSPGMVHTDMTQEAYADEEFRRLRASFAPAGYIADPLQDIAGVVAFLLSDDARYCNGQNIVVDGGVTDSMLRILPVRTS